MTLSETEQGFFFAALGQLDPALRPIFAERVARFLGAHPDPGPGDVDRAGRQALVGLWVPPESIELRAPPRWDRDVPGGSSGLQNGPGEGGGFVIPALSRAVCCGLGTAKLPAIVVFCLVASPGLAALGR